MAKSKTITLISGANAGIGLAVAGQLAKDHGHHVIVGSRNAKAGQEVATDLAKSGLSASSVQLDITSDQSIAAAIQQIERDFGRLDVLINNAAILIDYTENGREENKELSTRDLFARTFSTNVVGTACLTEACIPLLRRSDVPRLVFVSSVMGSLTQANNKSTPYYHIDYKAYDSSKAAINMLAINYARNLADIGALVNTVCPGLVQTKLSNQHPYGTSTDVGARRIVQLATLEKGGPTATFSDRNGSIPW